VKAAFYHVVFYCLRLPDNHRGRLGGLQQKNIFLSPKFSENKKFSTLPNWLKCNVDKDFISFKGWLLCVVFGCRAAVLWAVYLNKITQPTAPALKNKSPFSHFFILIKLKNGGGFCF
jgi:hypothetical protein